MNFNKSQSSNDCFCLTKAVFEHGFQYEENDATNNNNLKVRVIEKNCYGLYKPSAKAMMDMPQMQLIAHSKSRFAKIDWTFYSK